MDFRVKPCFKAKVKKRQKKRQKEEEKEEGEEKRGGGGEERRGKPQIFGFYFILTF